VVGSRVGSSSLNFFPHNKRITESGSFKKTRGSKRTLYTSTRLVSLNGDTHPTVVQT
jgi:hypothetical protein